MTLLIIGSTAARKWFSDWREPKDFDAFTEVSYYGDCFWDERLRSYIESREGNAFATPSELLTIKASHSYWELDNGSWSKHIHDILELQKRGATLIPELHDLLYGIWEDRHGKKVVDLTQEAEDFFADAVKRVYDHDSIHRSVAVDGQPIYEECLKDGKSVQMDMAKVWAMPRERQLQMFREEIYVTALERRVIPSGYTFSAGAAYQWALRRTITSLTKGRSARFLVENIGELIRPNMRYVDWHRQNSAYLIPLKES